MSFESQMGLNIKIKKCLPLPSVLRSCRETSAYENESCTISPETHFKKDDCFRPSAIRLPPDNVPLKYRRLNSSIKEVGKNCF